MVEQTWHLISMWMMQSEPGLMSGLVLVSISFLSTCINATFQWCMRFALKLFIASHCFYQLQQGTSYFPMTFCSSSFSIALTSSDVNARFSFLAICSTLQLYDCETSIHCHRTQGLICFVLSLWHRFMWSECTTISQTKNMLWKYQSPSAIARNSFSGIVYFNSLKLNFCQKCLITPCSWTSIAPVWYLQASKHKQKCLSSFGESKHMLWLTFSLISSNAFCCFPSSNPWFIFLS